MSEKVYVQVGVKGRSLPQGGEAGQILQKASDADFDLIWTTPAGGTSANIPQPAVVAPLPDAPSASVGTGVSFARHDHVHPMLVNDGVNPQMDGTADPGDDNYFARRDHVHPSDTSKADVSITPHIGSVTLAKASWSADGSDWKQTVSITGLTATSNTKVDIQYDKTAVKQMDTDGTLAIYIANSSGTLTAYAVGEKPTANLTLQVMYYETV